MIVLLAFIAGFALGWFRAKKREGNTADCIQYGFAHAMAFALLAVIVTLILSLGFAA